LEAARVKQFFSPAAYLVVSLLTLPGRLGAQDVQINLDPSLDQYGSQIETTQIYSDAGGLRPTFGIYDTGASVVSFSADDQSGFLPPIPIKAAGGATAEGVGGSLVGDVSAPGAVLADGLHALGFDASFNLTFDTSHAVSVPGVQAFVGTSGGSPLLPTITGTPINNPSPTNPGGTAARVDMQGYSLNLGDILGNNVQLVLPFPDLKFVAPGTPLVAPAAGSTPTITVPLSMFGGNNYLAPGNTITASPNPVQPGVALHNGVATSAGQTFLFDTGSQITAITPAIAAKLGLDLNNPTTTLDVQGAGGVVHIPGFTIDSLELPRSDLAGSVLRLSHVPVYVLDSIGGLDGILGMNLWNTAQTILYDPFNPSGSSVSFTFSTNPDRTPLDPTALSNLALLATHFPAFSGALQGGRLPTALQAVPEPGSAVLLIMGAAVLVGVRWSEVVKPSCWPSCFK